MHFVDNVFKRLGIRPKKHHLDTTVRPMVTMRGAWVAPVPRINGLVRQCCYCRRVHICDDRWEIRLAVSGSVTHGACPRCTAAILKDANYYKEVANAK